MALDPQVTLLFEQEAERARAAQGGGSLEERRAARQSRPQAAAASVYETEDRVVLGPKTEFKVRIYVPGDKPPYPAMVWIAGGGWSVGDVESTDVRARDFCHGANCIVISVNYHRMPEHRFPVAAEECYAALQWAATRGQDWGVDPNRIAVGGESSGGALAAAVPLMARDRGGPKLVFQLLMTALLDQD